MNLVLCCTDVLGLNLFDLLNIGIMLVYNAMVCFIFYFWVLFTVCPFFLLQQKVETTPCNLLLLFYNNVKRFFCSIFDSYCNCGTLASSC